jgi:alpha-beta hydrolase superfamily lysophospholipase
VIRARRIVLPALALAAIVQVVQWARVFRLEYATFCGEPEPVDTEAARRVVPAIEAVAWRGPAGMVRGWFVPGRERAAVVLAHGMPGTRATLLDEVRILSQRGFSVLAFDWPGHGESEGCSQWGAVEQGTLGSALDWLAARPETRGAPVGAFGFSAGGYPVVQRATRDPRLHAVALAAPVTDAVALARWEYRARSLGVLAHWPALAAFRLRGMQPRERVPAEIVGEIGPRPVLVIYGADDRIIPESMPTTLYRRASAPKELLRVPGAGHGGYAQAAPQLYAERLTTFFARALLGGHPAAGAAQ